MLPTVYKDVQRVWRTKRIQAIRNSTKSVHTKKMSAESREWLINGPLKWDYELYTYGRFIFNERLRTFGLIPENDEEYDLQNRHVPVFNATRAAEVEQAGGGADSSSRERGVEPKVVESADTGGPEKRTTGTLTRAQLQMRFFSVFGKI